VTPPTWSRRPYIGALPKALVSDLPAAEAMAGLRALVAEGDIEGAVEGNTAWLRRRGFPRPPASTLKLRVVDHAEGARVECRFDASRWDEIDLWVYGGAATVGFVVAGSWVSGHMPEATRGLIAGAVPAAIGALAALSAGHYAFRRWRQSVRSRLFDRAMIAMGVPIS
jgi:hypothetical protein